MTRGITIALIAVCCVLALAAATPAKGENKHVKPVHEGKKKYPTAIAGGYASTHGGDDDDEEPEKDEPETNDEQEEPQDDAEDEEEPTPAPVKPTRKHHSKPIKSAKSKKPVQDEEEDDDTSNGGVSAVATSIASGPNAKSNSRALAFGRGLPPQLRRRFH